MLPITAGNHRPVTGVFVLSYSTAVDKIITVVSSRLKGNVPHGDICHTEIKSRPQNHPHGFS